MIAYAWLALAVILVAVEMHHWAFFAIFGAVGALAAAGVAFAAPSAVGPQLGAAVVATAMGVFLARPFVSRAFLRSHGESAARGVHGGFVGELVEVIDTVTATPGGHVRLVGETWLARADDDEVLLAGSRAVVTAVTGTTLTVSGVSQTGKPGNSRIKLEQLREHYERIVDNRAYDSDHLPGSGDLRPPPDDQHRAAG